jgi:hypothetical protein
MPRSTTILYYFADGNRRRGPFTLDQIRSYPLRANTLVWREGLKVWTELRQVPELWAIFAERLVEPPVEAAAYQIPDQPPDPRQAALLGEVPQTSFFGDSTPSDLRDSAASALRNNPLAIASVVLGLIAMPAWCLPWGFALSGPLALAALVTGFVARRRAIGGDGRPAASAGIALGAVSLAMTLIVGAFLLFYSATMPPPARLPTDPPPATGSGVP